MSSNEQSGFNSHRSGRKASLPADLNKTAAPAMEDIYLTRSQIQLEDAQTSKWKEDMGTPLKIAIDELKQDSICLDDAKPVFKRINLDSLLLQPRPVLKPRGKKPKRPDGRNLK